MAFGRGKLRAGRPACAVALAAALAISGCSSEKRENELRPPIPAGVSVNVGPERLSVSPQRVAYGPERHQELLEIDEDEQLVDDPAELMPVELTIANTLSRDVKVAIAGPARRVSPVVTATGTASLATELPAGAYTVGVIGAEGLGQERLRVGPVRVSPQNVLQLP